jgi:hypothetical protein
VKDDTLIRIVCFDMVTLQTRQDLVFYGINLVRHNLTWDGTSM